jgi:F420-dependent oxidoreductase-like protein
MRFGVQMSRWRTGIPDFVHWIAEEAEGLGVDSIWTSESYGGDAFTPLAWMAAKTSRVRLATGISAMPARAPAATAMQAMSLDHLSEGRFVLGLGVSGPRVSEGWFGVPFGRPLRRTREYVDIVRQVVGREAPLLHDGEHYRIPATDAVDRGLVCYLHPRRPRIPVYLGVQGPKNIALSAEMADGMVTGLFAPRIDDFYAEQLRTGFRAAGHEGRTPGFEAVAIVDTFLGDTLTDAADQYRPNIAFYVARMGPRGSNYYYDTFVRLGYEGLCEEIIAAYDADGQDAAARLVPDEMVADVTLVGPLDKVLDDIEHKWGPSIIDLMVLRGDPESVKTVLRATCAAGAD